MMDELIIEPREVYDMMQRGVKFLLLDCREPWEYQTARIEGAMLIPMRQIPQKLDDLPKDQPVVVYCHAGVRSFDTASWLKQQGMDAVSMSGGIDRWSMEIDPKVPRY
ncbi:MAG: rhodanese-like domain-containing protein [Terriglobia bacterium]|jgi:rhodanese-related sulfurtransferase